jgi:hypothetical protein
MLTKRLVQLIGLATICAFSPTTPGSPSAANVTQHSHQRLSAVSTGHPDHSAVRVATSARSPAIPSPGPGELPVVVDGRTTPDAIPDGVAYRHFISTTSIPKTASAEQLLRRTLRLRSVGLSVDDQRSYIEAIRPLRDDLDRIAVRRAQAASARRGNVLTTAAASLPQEEEMAFEQARARLDAALSHEGRERLDAFIRGRVKRHIKIYGSLPASR